MGMTFTSYNALRNVSNIRFNWDLLPIPKVPMGNTCFVCNYAAITRDSQKKYYAREFLKELTSTSVQEYIKESFFLLPVDKQICKNRSITPAGVPIHYHSYIEDLEAMLPVSDCFLPQNLQTELEYQMILCANGIRSIAETAKTIADIYHSTAQEYEELRNEAI